MSLLADGEAALRSAVQGAVLTPTTRGFDASHLGFNLAGQHTPDVVVRATGAGDVAAAVRFGAECGVPVRVQATGHGMGIPMSGGVLVTTDGMQAVTVDPRRRSALVAAGARWADVISAAAQHRLATLCGSSPTVGAVGYTLGGGMGPMARTFGFNSDRVRRIEMVDAGGHIVEIDALSEPELFWALRGGKPDVGIVTELEFELVDAPHYYGGGIFYPGDQAGRVLHAFVGWAPTMPESVTTSIALLRLPDMPEVPEPLRGKLSVHLRFVHIGGPDQGASLLAPMRAVTAPLVDLVETNTAGAIASVHQDPTDPMPARDEGLLLRELPTEAVDALLAAAGPGVDVPLVIVELRLMGGALSRPGEVDSAVGGRDAAWNVCVIGPYPPPLRDAVDACSAAVLDAVRPWAAGTQANFQGYATAPEQVRAAWTTEVRARLDAIKQTHDPEGRFCFAHPAA